MLPVGVASEVVDQVDLPSDIAREAFGRVAEVASDDVTVAVVDHVVEGEAALPGDLVGGPGRLDCSTEFEAGHGGC